MISISATCSTFAQRNAPGERRGFARVREPGPDGRDHLGRGYRAVSGRARAAYRAQRRPMDVDATMVPANRATRQTMRRCGVSSGEGGGWRAVGGRLVGGWRGLVGGATAPGLRRDEAVRTVSAEASGKSPSSSSRCSCDERSCSRAKWAVGGRLGGGWRAARVRRDGCRPARGQWGGARGSVRPWWLVLVVRGCGPMHGRKGGGWWAAGGRLAGGWGAVGGRRACGGTRRCAPLATVPPGTRPGRPCQQRHNDDEACIAGAEK